MLFPSPFLANANAAGSPPNSSKQDHNQRFMMVPPPPLVAENHLPHPMAKPTTGQHHPYPHPQQQHQQQQSFFVPRSPPLDLGTATITTDEDLMLMEQEVEASHLAARLTLARLRAARAAQASNQQQQQQQEYQQCVNNMARMSYPHPLHLQQQQQQQQPRIVSPIKLRQQPHQPRTRPNRGADGAPSTLSPASTVPGLDLLHTASLSVASSDATTAFSSTNKSPSSPLSVIPTTASLNATRLANSGGPNLMPTLPLVERRFSNESTASASSLPPPAVQIPAGGGRGDDRRSSTNGSGNAQHHQRVYIDKVRPTDILCGRGGRSNHHPGNKRYRLIVGNIKYMYQQCPAKTMKTDLSRAIVESCFSYGARFIKLDDSSSSSRRNSSGRGKTDGDNDGEDRYYVLSKAEARKKTSQALRETKALKWTH